MITEIILRAKPIIFIIQLVTRGKLKEHNKKVYLCLWRTRKSSYCEVQRECAFNSIVLELSYILY